jgi:hypothetical protein
MRDFLDLENTGLLRLQRYLRVLICEVEGILINICFLTKMKKLCKLGNE